MREVDKAWLAGLIEGEGCFTILAESTCKKGKIYVHYRPYITISNTSVELLEWVQKILGYGRIYHYSRPPWKAEHTLCVYNKAQIIRLCQDILPYLIAKRKHAMVLIEACQPNSDLNKLYQAIRALNKRGE